MYSEIGLFYGRESNIVEILVFETQHMLNF